MIVDANVFLEVILDQRHGESCRAFLNAVKDGDRDATVTAYHVDAVAYVVEELDGGDGDVQRFLASLMRYDGLAVRNQSLLQKIQACRIMDETDLDFDDSLAVQAARDEGHDRIVTLDSDFRAVADVTSVHPVDC